MCRNLRGRKGICPGNRLKLVDFETGCYSPTSPLASPCSTSMSMSASTLTFSSQMSQPSELYENTSNKSIKGKRRSWHIMPNRVSGLAIAEGSFTFCRVNGKKLEIKAEMMVILMYSEKLKHLRVLRLASRRIIWKSGITEPKLGFAECLRPFNVNTNFKQLIQVKHLFKNCLMNSSKSSHSF